LDKQFTKHRRLQISLGLDIFRSYHYCGAFAPVTVVEEENGKAALLPVMPDGNPKCLKSMSGRKYFRTVKCGGPPDLEAVLARHNEITGFNETNPAAIGHHRLSLFGPLCDTCDKPLRTSQAKYCVACGTPPRQSLISVIRLCW
jgi:hypothetical protein